MCRNSHDCCCSITTQYIVSCPDRHFFTVERVYCISACEYACLRFLAVNHSFKITLGSSGTDVLPYFSFSFRRAYPEKIRMLRSQNAECCSVDSIDSCCIHRKADLVSSLSFHRENDLSTFRTANPVALHGFYRLRPIQVIKIIKKPVGIFSNPEIPLRKLFPCYLSVTSPADASSGFLV